MILNFRCVVVTIVYYYIIAWSNSSFRSTGPFIQRRYVDDSKTDLAKADFTNFWFMFVRRRRFVYWIDGNGKPKLCYTIAKTQKFMHTSFIYANSLPHSLDVGTEERQIIETIWQI